MVSSGPGDVFLRPLLIMSGAWVQLIAWKTWMGEAGLCDAVLEQANKAVCHAKVSDLNDFY